MSVNFRVTQPQIQSENDREKNQPEPESQSVSEWKGEEKETLPSFWFKQTKDQSRTVTDRYTWKAHTYLRDDTDVKCGYLNRRHPLLNLSNAFGKVTQLCPPRDFLFSFFLKCSDLRFHTFNLIGIYGSVTTCDLVEYLSTTYHIESVASSGLDWF